MPKTRAQKKESVSHLVEQLRGSKAAVFASMVNVSIKEASKLRTAGRATGVTCHVSKKSLVGIALKEANQPAVDLEAVRGTLTVGLATADEVSAAKVFQDFAKGHETFTILGGILEGRFISASEVKSLAALPSREQLLGQLVGTLQAPISGFVRVLAGVPRNFVQVLSAIKDAKV